MLTYFLLKSQVDAFNSQMIRVPICAKIPLWLWPKIVVLEIRESKNSEKARFSK